MRQQYYRERMVSLAKGFAEHEILSFDELDEHRAILRIGKPGCCNLLTDIAFGLGCIVVWGDIDTCCFQGHSGPYQDALAWLGVRSDWHYLQSKASRGTGWDAVREYDVDVAKYDILDGRRHGGISAKAAREAWDVLAGDDGSVEQASRALYDADCDGESCNIGEVVSRRVLCAVAAIRRAHELVSGRAHSVPISECGGKLA